MPENTTVDETTKPADQPAISLPLPEAVAVHAGGFGAGGGWGGKGSYKPTKEEVEAEIAAVEAARLADS